MSTINNKKNHLNENNINKIYKPIILDNNNLPTDYDDVVDESLLYSSNLSKKDSKIKKITPDPFQKHGFYQIEKNNTIFVSAHTSSGKTLIAEYAIHKAIKNGRRVIYTSPIKALSNQKYYDFKNKFNSRNFKNIEESNSDSSEDSESLVGIITGDIQLNVDAPILIMTTEILRNQLYQKTPDKMLDSVDYVIFDEIHYINEAQRGVVWEECLILMLERINFIMLSATISNNVEFCNWISKMKNRDVYIIGTEKRVVPLDIKIIRNNCLYNTTGNLIEEIKFKETRKNDFLLNLGDNKKSNKKVNKNDMNVFRQPDLFKINVYAIARYIKENKLTPSIFFCFSKKMCHIHAKSLKAMNFLNKVESMKVENFIFKILTSKIASNSNNNINNNLAVNNSDALNYDLPQVENIIELLKLGIGIHHSSLLPILKEITEILFSNNYIKILIATETFSVGVNYPAKSVVFLNIYKFNSSQNFSIKLKDKINTDDHNNKEQNILTSNNKVEFQSSINKMRLLNQTEFVQMSGRAGRRGVDKLGYVFIADKKLGGPLLIKNMIASNTNSCRITSKFKLSFTMILSMIKNNKNLKEILLDSFGENQHKQNYMDCINKYEEYSKELELYKNNCEICKENNIKIILNLMNEIIEKYQSILINEDLKNLFNDNPNLIFIDHLLNKNYTKKNDIEKELENLNIKNKNLPILILKNSNILPKNLKELKNIERLMNLFNNLMHNQLFLEFKSNKHKNLVYIISDIKLLISKLQNYTKHIKNFVTKNITINGNYFGNCEDHLSINLNYITIEKKMKILMNTIGLNNLKLLKELNMRINFLKEKEFIDQNNNLTLKGEVASEIKTVDAIIFTDMLFNNEFKDKTNIEIFSIMASFVQNNEIIDEIDYIEDFLLYMEENYINVIDNFYENNNISDTIEYNPTTSQCVYRWCNGMSLKQLLMECSISEGGFVKVIMRMDEFYRELLLIGDIIGNKELNEKFKDFDKCYKRDLIFSNSIYVDEEIDLTV